MLRREFLGMVASTALSRRAVAGPWLPLLQDGAETYSHFCATPSGERVFHELRQGRFVTETLDESTWQVSPNSESGPNMPPELPVPGGSWNGVPMRSPFAGLGGQGPYAPTWESLLQYEVPDWYRNAKFGIWAHWGPQCVPEAGDWYARNMYVQGSEQYKYHLEHFGHPSQFGFKDLCPQWTILNWQPEELMQRYKRAGARFFLALANHHDNLDSWNSKYNPWNAVNVGPRRDVIATWGAAARRHGMRFGVTVHQARNWWWLQTAHGSDSTGPMAGIPYDGHLTARQGSGQWWQGLDPQTMYAPKHPPMALPDVSYVKNFYDRTCDLIDQSDPDLLYLDNSLPPLGWGGMNVCSYFYNHNLKTHAGKMQGVLTTKQVPDRLLKALVADYERGTTSEIAAYPWQSELCIGHWHYDRSLFEMPGEYGGYLSPQEVIHWLIDTVSKNGTFILNIPGRPDGTIDAKEIAILDRIGEWLQVNGEGIYDTRPWRIYGEGPEVVSGATSKHVPAILGPQDIRFTRNQSNTVVYAFVLGWPEEKVVIRSLAASAANSPDRIARVELLGDPRPLRFAQDAAGLRVSLPANKISDTAIGLKLSLA